MFPPVSIQSKPPTLLAHTQINVRNNHHMSTKTLMLQQFIPREGVELLTLPLTLTTPSFPGCHREATVTSLPPGGTVSLGVSRQPPPDDDSGELLSRLKLGDGEKTWGFCTSDGGAAGAVSGHPLSAFFFFHAVLPLMHPPVRFRE